MGKSISNLYRYAEISKACRTLKKLRQHGLIKKVPRSRRYHVTSKGRQIMGILIQLYHKDYPELIAKTA